MLTPKTCIFPFSRENTNVTYLLENKNKEIKVVFGLQTLLLAQKSQLDHHQFSDRYLDYKFEAFFGPFAQKLLGNNHFPLYFTRNLICDVMWCIWIMAAALPPKKVHNHG